MGGQKFVTAQEDNVVYVLDGFVNLCINWQDVISGPSLHPTLSFPKEKGYHKETTTETERYTLHNGRGGLSSNRRCREKHAQLRACVRACYAHNMTE